MPFAQADGARIFWRRDGRDAGAPVANTAFAQARRLLEEAGRWEAATTCRNRAALRLGAIFLNALVVPPVDCSGLFLALAKPQCRATVVRAFASRRSAARLRQVVAAS